MSRYIDVDDMITHTENMRAVADSISIDGIIRYLNENAFEIDWGKHTTITGEAGKNYSVNNIGELETDGTELQKAIELLKEKFAEGCRLSYVRHPLAWALYYTWVTVDKNRTRGEEDDNT